MADVSRREELDEFSTPMSSGMRRVSHEEAVARGAVFSKETRARLEAFLDETDRCRNRAAVEARTAWIG